MKYFLDTEFIERGPYFPVQLISIGIVAEDGRELYLENAGARLHDACDWVKKNVVPHLKGTIDVLRNLDEIEEEIVKFIPPLVGAPSSYKQPEFWGYFADYDWVVFCQIFGTMMDLPKGYPMFCMDCMQLARHMWIPRNRFPEHEGTEHNALDDARWTKKVFDFLAKEAK